MVFLEPITRLIIIGVGNVLRKIHHEDECNSQILMNLLQKAVIFLFNDMYTFVILQEFFNYCLKITFFRSAN